MTTPPPSGDPPHPSGSGPLPDWSSAPTRTGPSVPEPSAAEPFAAGHPGRHGLGQELDWRIVTMSIAVVLLVVAGLLVYVRGGTPATPARARLERALTATNAAVTADMTLDAKASFDGVSFDVTGSGSVDFASQAASLDMHAFGHAISVVEANGVLYVKVGTLVSTQFPGKTWVRMPVSAFAGAHSGQMFVTNDPAELMAALVKVGAAVTPIGTATIAGSQDQGYRVRLTLAALRAHASELPPSARALFSTAKLPTTATVSTVMYVNPAGELQAAHVRVIALTTGHQVTASVDITMSHFGTASVPPPPPATQTVTYHQLKGMLGLGNVPSTAPGGTRVT